MSFAQSLRKAIIFILYVQWNKLKYSSLKKTIKSGSNSPESQNLKKKAFNPKTRRLVTITPPPPPRENF